MGIIISMASISIGSAVASKLLSSWGRVSDAQLLDTVATGSLICTAIGIAINTIAKMKQL